MTLCATALFTLTARGTGQPSQSSDEDQGRPKTGSGAIGAGQTAAQKYPNVVKAELESSEGDTWPLSVTISPPCDSPERYAGGWRVLSPDGTILGKNELMHDHAGEQPFTRTQSGLGIPPDVQKITLEARDLKNGYGGDTVAIPVERG